MKSNRILQGIGAMTLLVITFSAFWNTGFAAPTAGVLYGNPTAYINGVINISVSGEFVGEPNITMNGLVINGTEGDIIQMGTFKQDIEIEKSNPTLILDATSGDAEIDFSSAGSSKMAFDYNTTGNFLQITDSDNGNAVLAIVDGDIALAPAEQSYAQFYFNVPSEYNSRAMAIQQNVNQEALTVQNNGNSTGLLIYQTGTGNLIAGNAVGGGALIRFLNATEEVFKIENNGDVAKMGKFTQDIDMNSNELNGIGQMQFNPSELTISSGVVTVTRAHHNIDTESDSSSDDLVTINGGSHGDILIITPQSMTRTVVAKDETGNLELAGDFTMDNRADSLMLRYDLGIGKWCEISRSDNGA